jgi:hypothetical protein
MNALRAAADRKGVSLATVVRQRLEEKTERKHELTQQAA